MKLGSSPINAKILFELFCTLFEDKFSETKPPRFNLKDLSLLRKLIDEQGAKKAYVYIKRCFKQWDRLKKEFSLYGYPTVGMFWGYRFSFFEFLTQLRKNSVSYEKGIQRRKNNTQAQMGVFAERLYCLGFFYRFNFYRQFGGFSDNFCFQKRFEQYSVFRFF